MPSIAPFLWFDNNAEEAVNLYVSLFKNSRITNVSHYGEAGPLPAGTVMVVNFELEGREFMAMNGGPGFPFTEAISLFVSVDTQEEVDLLWERLTEGGGEPVQCGWLKDRFGLRWQIIPKALMELIGGGDTARSQRVMRAMFEMTKIDVPTLLRAAEGDAA